MPSYHNKTPQNPTFKERQARLMNHKHEREKKKLKGKAAASVTWHVYVREQLYINRAQPYFFFFFREIAENVSGRVVGEEKSVSREKKVKSRFSAPAIFHPQENLVRKRA